MFRHDLPSRWLHPLTDGKFENTKLDEFLMLKRINALINIVIGVSIGVFIGYGVYSFWDFKSHPELYAMQSAPWYTRLILWGAVTIGIVAIAAIIKLIIRKRIHEG